MKNNQYKAVSAAAISLLSFSAASPAAVLISAVGGGSGYDETNMVAFRSSSVAKSFDVDGDDIYGTEGTYFTGDGSTTGNGLTPDYTQTGISWTTFSNGADLANYTGSATAYGIIDNPTLSGPTVADWGAVGISIAAGGGGLGSWNEILTFDIADAPTTFRIGLVTGNQNAANGRWDPTGLRLSVDGGAATEVTGIANNANTDTGWVFFDVDLNGETTGTFSIEGQQRLAGQGASLTGVTFDSIPEPSTGILAGLAGLSLVLRRRRTLSGKA